MTPTFYRHIGLDDLGRATIVRSSLRVSRVVVLMHLARSPAKIADQFEGVTIAEVHSALAYYFDHIEQVDDEIRQEDELVETMRRVFDSSELADRLRAVKAARRIEG